MRHLGPGLFLDPPEAGRSYGEYCDYWLAGLAESVDCLTVSGGAWRAARTSIWVIRPGKRPTLASIEKLRTLGWKRAPNRRGSEKPLLVEDSRPAPLDLSWLFAAVNEGSNRSSSQQLMKVVSALNSLLKARRFTDLNYMLSKLQPERLSPELMLTFARLTFPVRELLSNWYSFVRKVKKELESREMDSKRMLQGLI
jgi:hypothetical protein